MGILPEIFSHPLNTKTLKGDFLLPEQPGAEPSAESLGAMTPGDVAQTSAYRPQTGFPPRRRKAQEGFWSEPRNGYRRWVAESGARPNREFACVLVNIDGPLGDRIREMSARVADEDLAEKGREDVPHATVLFGLHADDPAEVEHVLAGFGHIEGTLGETSVFHGEQYDVVKIDIDSPDLHRCHDTLAQLPHTDTHPEYRPHVTLAYVKPGAGQQYAGMADLDGERFEANMVVFSGKDRRKTDVPVFEGYWTPGRNGAPRFVLEDVAVDIAAAQTNTMPTEAAKKSGRYEKGVVKLHGLEIHIENPRGSYREGTDPNGNHWRQELHAHYGYVQKVNGKIAPDAVDGDKTDVFLGEHPEAELVFVVDQFKPDGTYDEPKTMIGWLTEEDARAGYLSNYEDGWTCGPITSMTVEQFRAWLKSGDRGPVSEYKPLLRVSEGFWVPARNGAPRFVLESKKAWDKGKHPRGHEGNSGQFAEKGSSFTPAKESHDAKAFAETHIAHSVDFTGVDVGLANAINKTLLEHLPKGVKLTEIRQDDLGNDSIFSVGWGGGGSDKDGNLTFDGVPKLSDFHFTINSRFRDEASINAVIRKANEDAISQVLFRSVVADNAAECVVHEVGHILSLAGNRIVVRDGVRKIVGSQADKIYQSMTKIQLMSSLSMRASTDSSEMAAEAYAAFRNGTLTNETLLRYVKGIIAT